MDKDRLLTRECLRQNLYKVWSDKTAFAEKMDVLIRLIKGQDTKTAEIVRGETRKEILEWLRKFEGYGDKNYNYTFSIPIREWQALKEGK